MKTKQVEIDALVGLSVESFEETNSGVILHFEDGIIAVCNAITVIELVGEAPVAKPDAPAPAAKTTTPPAKPAAPAAKPAPAKMTWEKLEDMDEDELKELIDDEDLEIKTKGKDEEELRTLIAKALKIEIPSDDDDDDSNDDDDLSWDDLSQADFDELSELVKDQKELKSIEIEDYDEDSVAQLRKAIAKKLGIAIPAKK